MTDRHHLSRLLKPKELNLAIETFNKIIVHFDASQTNDSGYKPATLIDLIRNEVFEKDDFLGLFFAYIQQGLLDESRGTDLDPILSHLAGFCNWSAEEKDKLSGSLGAFARYLVDNFFLPLNAFVVKTPQPTPAPSHRGTAIGTLQRVSTLRRDCLHRNRHRCVITRRLDAQEAKSRYKKDRCNLKDDEGKSLLPERDAMAYLEVAHIIPHPLRSLIGKEGERKPERDHDNKYFIAS